MPKLFGLIFMTPKEYNAVLNTTYSKGYDSGYRTGRLEGMYATTTPNKIREAFGLEPIKGDVDEFIIRRD